MKFLGLILHTTCSFVLVVFLVGPVSAAETRWWINNRAEDFIKGEGNGVAVAGSGELEAVDTWRKTVDFTEAVIGDAREEPEGALLVVTGHPSRLYRVADDTSVLLAEIPAEQATAVLPGKHGDAWIATMAPGLILYWNGKELEERGRLEEGGFYDLIRFDGQIIAAAGPPAALFRLDEAGLQRWAEVPDSFVRCLAVSGDRVLAGSSGTGLILSFSRQGVVSLVADSPFTEISEIVVSPRNEIWAVALVGEPVSNGGGKKKGEDSGKDKAGNGSGKSMTLDLDLPKVDGKTAVSELLRLTPEGGLLEVHRFPKQVAGALALDGDGVLVGTGYEGELWRFSSEGGTRLASLDAVETVRVGPEGRFLLTQGPAACFFRDSGGKNHRFRSESKTFERPVRFGRYRILREAGNVEIRFRTGGGSKEKPLWLAWGPWLRGLSADSGVGFGRAVQWEVRLPDGGRVGEVGLAYREVNLPPKFSGVDVEKPGLIYLSTPPMGGPVISEDHPTFDGIFTTLGTHRKKSSTAKNGKKYWQKGYRTLNWECSDANEDPLRFDVFLEFSDGEELCVKKDLKGTQLAVDLGAVPDGVYRFRVTAKDETANPGKGFSVSRRSRWFDVDNTPPVIRLIRHEDGAEVEVSDSSALEKVEYSLDGSPWRPLEPVDGLLDGGDESFQINVDTEFRVFLVRVYDVHHNRAVASLKR